MKALVIVDMQNDFLPGGALGVKKGEEVVPTVNSLTHGPFDLIVATKDWHPADHTSFAENHAGKEPGEHVTVEGIDQILWPAHCVQESFGAEFSSDLEASGIDKIFYKGIDPNIDSYSAFFDNKHLRATGLGEYLKEQGVETVYLAGLTTDYCVKYSALDALALGFETYVIEDGCRAVNLEPEDGEKAIREMKEKGVKVVHSSEVLQ